MPNIVSQNTSGSSDNELRSEFDTLFANGFAELVNAMFDLLMYNGTGGVDGKDDPLITAYWLLRDKPYQSSDNDYEDPDFDYDTSEQNNSEYEYRKKELIDLHGIDIDKLIFDPNWPDNREVNSTITFFSFNMKKFPNLFKEAYVRCIKNLPDGSMSRKLVEQSNPEADDLQLKVNLVGAQLTKVPAYIKKYSTLDDVHLSSNNFTKLNKDDFPEKIGELNISNCPTLIEIGPNTIPITNDLKLVNCKNLKKVHYKINPSSYMNRINIRGTMITSTEQIIFPQGDLSDYIVAISIPENYTSLKCNNPTLVTRYQVTGPLTNIRTFYGMNLDTFFYMEYTGGIYELDLDKYIPNINNAKLVYKAYREIYGKYPDLVTNEYLGRIYNAIQPTSLMEFELVLNKIKAYSIPMDDAPNISLLISLLKK